MEFASLDKERFAPVVDALQTEAQVALAESPAKRVPADEAARLVGRPLPTSGEYVLLRAVVLNERTGGFEVSVGGKAVFVNHGCIGRDPLPMARRALVAVLPEVPDTVYVSCCMAE